MHFNYRYGTLGDHSTSKTILWTLSFIGVLIIIMASINFINLSTAQAVGRSREVGIRKVLGSTRKQLIGQVMGETFLLVLFSIILAVIFAKLALPYLSNVANVPAGIGLLTTGSIVFLLLTLIIVHSIIRHLSGNGCIWFYASARTKKQNQCSQHWWHFFEKNIGSYAIQHFTDFNHWDHCSS